MNTHEIVLNNLESDIICFQEVKSTRASLPRHVAVPESYHSFFSFPATKGGYSGVAVYAKTASAIPCKAEEGLTGLLQPKPPLTQEERVSELDCYPPYDLDGKELDYKSLDSEGRALTLDFGLFVLINVYCPNDSGTEARIKYKSDFHTLLKERVRFLIEVEKREVILVGDLNACAAVQDHCEGDLIVQRGREQGLEGDEGFYAEYEVREWLRSWLHPENNPARMVDITRQFWPDRKGMYTCWNTKLSARDSNYGTRIDYILITPDLLPWIKASDIQPKIKGSDHCPVYVDLHDEIQGDAGNTIKLKDFIHCGRTCPRIAANNWDEYSGKQRMLDTFFSKRTPSSVPQLEAGPSISTSPTPLSGPLPPKRKLNSDSPEMPETVPKRIRSTSSSASVASSSKSQTKDSKAPAKQGKLTAFFSEPKSKGKLKMDDDVDLEADYQLALSLSQDAEPIPLPDSQQSSSSMSQSWSTILAPLKPPLCTVHGEPAKELKVTKTGANKGKGFWICARPLGPGYDKGRSERPRHEVDPRWRCNFFKWSSDVRKEMLRSNTNS